MTTPAADDGHDHDVLTVAVAMLRYGLPGAGAEGDAARGQPRRRQDMATAHLPDRRCRGSATAQR